MSLKPIGETIKKTIHLPHVDPTTGEILSEPATGGGQQYAPEGSVDRYGRDISGWRLAVGGGPTSMFSREQPQCDLCLDVGRLARTDLDVGDPGFGKSIPCPKCRGGRALIRIEDAMRIAGVPDPMRGYTLETYQRGITLNDSQARALAVARSLVGKARRKIDGDEDSPVMGMLLVGPTGTGKTGLAVGMLRALARKRLGVKFITWSAWLADIKRSWGSDTPTDTSVNAAALGIPDALVIDEFGTTGNRRSDWVIDAARLVAEERYNRAKRKGITIWTTNLDIESLIAEFGGISGEAILSRIRGCSFVQNIDGKDRRED